MTVAARGQGWRRVRGLLNGTVFQLCKLKKDLERSGKIKKDMETDGDDGGTM